MSKNDHKKIFLLSQRLYLEVFKIVITFLYLHLRIHQPDKEKWKLFSANKASEACLQ